MQLQDPAPSSLFAGSYSLEQTCGFYHIAVENLALAVFPEGEHRFHVEFD